MQAGQPYLSVVVTARNDDHGGNLLSRMQIFVSGWIAQARRFDLSSELIIVEWNPPSDRPRLQEALQWPAEFGPCAVRFIEVPSELHRRYKHAEAMPLYQMIAKNVGIRRAHGRFVLATNIDILFSDELMAFLAEQRLDRDRMYRIDRHDVMSEVPLEARIDDQLAFCRTHLLRLNAREGTFALTPEGLRTLEKEDIAAADSGLRFGPGWFPVERHNWDGEIFRWVDNDAELHVTLPSRPGVLRLELEPGPGMGGRPMVLHVCERKQMILTAEIKGRSLLRLPFARVESNNRTQLLLHVDGGGDWIPTDPRTMNFRVFSCRWERSGISYGKPAVAYAFRPGRRLAYLWHGFQELVNRLATSDFLVSVTIIVPPLIRRAAAFYLRWIEFKASILCKVGVRHKGKIRSLQLAAVQTVPGKVSFLHTCACGDFTLLARTRWFDLRAYPEFDLFSMNLDSVFCYVAHHSGVTEEVLPDPMRIYHIEHATGSGWTPEGQAQLFARIAAKGLSFISPHNLGEWASQMQRLDCPMIFNHDNWGLSEFELRESCPHPAQAPTPPQPSVRRAGESE